MDGCGYAWSFPGPARQVLGIAALKSQGLRLQDDFRRFLRDLKLSEPERLRLHDAHGLPYGSYLKIPGCGNTLLVGDAAGLADPFLGEGIYYAHRSAELAARAAIAGFARPAVPLAFYCESFRRCLLPEMR